MANTSQVLSIRSAAAQLRAADHIYRGLFERSPLPQLVLTPGLRIVDANDAYLAATARNRDALAGLDMFEAFPDSPHDPWPSGVRNLRASFGRVLGTGGQDAMALQRYDIKPEDGPWQTRYWHPVNWAVRDDAGSVLALVHHVADVTARVLAARPDGTAAGRSDGPGTRLAGADLIARADQAIQVAREIVAEAQWDQRAAKARIGQVLQRRDP